MKVGTDGVLLGAWAKVDGAAAQILDIGTGKRAHCHYVGAAGRAGGDPCRGRSADQAEQARENMEVLPYLDA